MTKFEINGKHGSFTLNLPNGVNEITEDFLKKVISCVNVAPHHVLIGVVYTDSLAFILNGSKKKQISIPTLPIFLKAGETDSEFIKSCKLKDKLIISGSDISLGHHVSSPYNNITLNKICSICEGDTNIYKTAFNSNRVSFLELKLVPNVAIHGVYTDVDNNDTYVDPYVTVNN